MTLACWRPQIIAIHATISLFQRVSVRRALGTHTACIAALRLKALLKTYLAKIVFHSEPRPDRKGTQVLSCY